MFHLPVRQPDCRPASATRAVGVAAWVGAMVLLALIPGPVAAQAIPPDTVTTVFVTDTIGDFGAVGGVAVDALGYVYIADFRNALWRLSPDGSLSLFADGFYGASGNAVGPKGYIYQSSFYGHYISRISRTGETETYVDEGLNGPVGITVAPDGTLFVVNCTGGTVSRIAPDRSVTEFVRNQLLACPNGITMDDRGDLYVVNFNSSKVVRITPDGSVSEFTDIVGAGGNGHIVFTRGAFYVTKFRGNQLFRVQRDGTYDVLAGTGAEGRDDGPALNATFRRPNGIGASPSGGELWVNDLSSGQGLGRGVSVVALRRVKVVSLSDVLSAVDPALGVEPVREAYHQYHAARAGEDSSAGAIALGYQWLTAGRIAEGVALFALNAGQFPADANAQYHFGEANRFTGNPQVAADQYRKALAIDPDHANAAARLAEVTSGG